MQGVFKRLSLAFAGLAASAGVFVEVHAANDSDFLITILDGALNVDIVDGTYQAVADPSVAMDELNFSFSPQTSQGILGTTSERILLQNPTATSAWSVDIQAASGAIAQWEGVTSGYIMDYNDPTVDGNGQLNIDPQTATFQQVGGGATGNLALGPTSAYNQGVVDSITLFSTSTAPNYSEYELLGVTLSQEVPAGQAVDDYLINMVLTAS